MSAAPDPDRRGPALGIVLAGSRGLLRVLTRTSLAGSLPATGGCVVAANHLSLLDPALLGTAVDAAGRVPRFMAARGLWSVPGPGWALRTGADPGAAGRCPGRRVGGPRRGGGSGRPVRGGLPGGRARA